MADWKITYDSWKPEEQPLREALCTLGNGYFATRGAAEESTDDEKVNYPGTYLAGGYNRLVSKVADRDIENEDFVNWPNWLPLSFRHSDEEEWFDLEKVELISFRQELDMKDALLKRWLHFRDKAGRETSIYSKRFVSMADSHVAAIEWEFTPVNWSGEVELRSALGGSVTNNGVPRYRKLKSKHLEPLQTGQHKEDTVFLLVQTNQSKIRMAQAARTRVYVEPIACQVQRDTHQKQDYVEQLLRLYCEQGHSFRLEKVVTLYTSRDFAISEVLQDACLNIDRLGSFTQLLEDHKRSWSRLWNRCDLGLACNDKAQTILRLHIFHLLQTASPHIVSMDVGIPARGLHGEAYRGHIFWDELFIFPFLNLHLPELTRALLRYRFHRLPEARFLAEEAGYKGAMFPWQSGSTGREESQVIHLNPKSGNWVKDDTHLQRHISAGIAYNVWQYFQATEDMEFLTFAGAEMIFDIAQFWSTIAVYNPKRERYEIHHVVGPDEYHTQYPDSDEPGLSNNAYTNVMAVWVIQCALGTFDILDESRISELFQKLNITDDDLERWRDISHKMFVPFIGDSNIIAQFEGYENLLDFPWDKYKQKYGESMRLDRILESEGDSVNRYKASKQADVLMLFYLFSYDELLKLFGQLNYELKPENVQENIVYYEQRTSHGSTLSKIVHSWVLARSDRKRSWSNFEVALVSDVEDVQGGTTPEGIHLGAMAGTVDLVQRGYTGLEIRDNVLWLDPALPEEIGCLNLQLRYRGHWLRLQATTQKLKITFDRGWSKEVQVGVKGVVYTFRTGDEREFDI
ncbi:glycoside hydrolase family 65 protein [Pontibacter silvestris]|uniref:Glycoside hydrolase family 65 protein n=1 Tax=Pontibacter silvestris TaxID=2305183 RepID=A0ABW4WU97_9BACT|nr:glycosyl hydrolase family 65 protein [Pontibacter silvestris]MCC9138009.1 glycoside hydrolase family 65 protein [Pontibacter silvestris]